MEQSKSGANSGDAPASSKTTPAADSPAHPKGVSIFSVADTFGAAFLDPAFCSIWFLDRAHGRGPHCPECASALTDEAQIVQYYALQRFTCRHCFAQLNARRGTILHGSKLTPRQYILLAFLLDVERSTKEIAERVGISIEAVRQWKRG